MNWELNMSKAFVGPREDFDDTHPDAAAALNSGDLVTVISEVTLDHVFLPGVPTDVAALNDEGIELFQEDSADSVILMSEMALDHAFLPGAPTDCPNLEMEFCDFASVSVAMELRCGKTFNFSGKEARKFAEERFPDIMCNGAEFSSVKIHAVTFPFALSGEHANSTKQIPLSWVNRIVSARLEFGDVMGLLSDACLRDGTYLYLVPLPGEPEIPPLPVCAVRGVLLMPKVMHASIRLSQDGQDEVHKYLIQKGESVWIRELQVNADSPIKTDIILSRNNYAEDLTFHMWYQRDLQEDGYVSAYFYRFPAPREADGNAAENEDWRMRWAVPNIHVAVMPNVNEYYTEFDEGYLEFLAEKKDGGDEERPGLLWKLQYRLWRSAQCKLAHNE